MRKALFYFAALVAVIVIAIGLGILVPRPLPIAGAIAATGVSEPYSRKHTRRILVLSSAIHTDIALPVSADVLSRFGFMAKDGLDPAMPGVHYLIAGWGGRSFYIETPTWADLKPGPVARALTIDRSVMHVSLTGAIDPAHPAVMPIDLIEAAFMRLLASIEASFTADAQGRPILVAGAQYTEFDRFYEAEGWFNALVGCNVWAGRMLREAGLTSGMWTPLPGLLTASLHLHNNDLAAPYSPAAR